MPPSTYIYFYAFVAFLMYTQVFCQNATCPCLNSGTCLNSSSIECKCPDGFYGTLCEYKKCDASDLKFKQCINGQCLTHTNSLQSICQCMPTHQGALCERPVCLDYCYNGAQCSDGLQSDKDYEDFLSKNYTAKLSCVCSSDRYTGDKCQFDKCFGKKCSPNCFMNSSCDCVCNSDCDKTYCNGKGVCTSVDDNLTCKCQIAYSGPTCAINECNGYCFNNGTCDITQDTYYCSCIDGFYGTRCEKRVKSNESTQTKERSSFRFLIYAFTITLSICLVSIGIYYSIQKGYLQKLRQNIPFLNRTRTASNSNRDMSFSFNKLEDEQSIVQNDFTMNA